MKPALDLLLRSLQLSNVRSPKSVEERTSPPRSSCKNLEYATCVLQPDPNADQELSGTIKFIEIDYCNTNFELSVYINITGFSCDTPRRFSIHEYGNLMGGCSCTGEAFNPCGTRHGDRRNNVCNRFVGDFGNIKPRNRKVIWSFRDKIASLQGKNSIIGRSVVIYDGTDDLVSRTGNAGRPIACCVIGYADSRWKC